MKIIIFSHIPRSSGKMILTFMVPHRYKRHDKFHRRLLSGLISQGFNLHPIGNFNFLAGSLPFGIHNHLESDYLDCKWSYYTFLRDPVKRWQSNFQHSIQFPLVIKDIWRKSNKNIVKFLDRCIEEQRNYNNFVRMLSGEELYSNFLREKRKYPYAWGSRKNIYNSDQYEYFLEKSKYNIINNIDFVGFCGNKKSYRGLCKFYGWQIKKIVVYNKSKNSMSIEWDNKKVKSRINELTKFDQKLYKFAVNKLKT